MTRRVRATHRSQAPAKTNFTVVYAPLPREHGKKTLEELFITVAREPLTPGDPVA